jgi:hypothetical protein
VLADLDQGLAAVKQLEPVEQLLEEMTDFPASEQVIPGLIYPTCMVLRYRKMG